MDLSGGEEEIPIPIPIPIPISSSYVGGHGENPLSIEKTEEHHHIIPYSSRKGVVVVRYKECLKNHAASIGGNATDGCGEFMPSGDEGTLEALKCSACGCHRNFHRREAEGQEASSSSCGYLRLVGQKGVLIPRAPPQHVIMPLGALHTSESEEMMGRPPPPPPPPPMVKKRFRTKFTPEQKERMLLFAEGAGWKLQKQEDSVVQQFCQEIGVKRRVLKVWMHNNKHHLANKNPTQQLNDC